MVFLALQETLASADSWSSIGSFLAALLTLGISAVAYTAQRPSGHPGTTEVDRPATEAGQPHLPQPGMDQTNSAAKFPSTVGRLSTTPTTPAEEHQPDGARRPQTREPDIAVGNIRADFVQTGSHNVGTYNGSPAVPSAQRTTKGPAGHPDPQDAH